VEKNANKKHMIFKDDLVSKLSNAKNEQFVEVLDYIQYERKYVTKEEMKVICERLRDGSMFEGERIASFLEEYEGSYRCVKPLIEMLYYEDVYTRSSVCKALGNIGAKRSIPALLEMLNDRDDFVRSDALEALRFSPDTFTIDSLKCYLYDKSDFMRCASIVVLWNKFYKNSNSKEEILDLVKERLKIERSGLVRNDIYEMIYFIENDKSALMKLVTMTKRKHPGVRMRVYSTLRSLINGDNYKIIEDAFKKALEVETINHYKDVLKKYLKEIKKLNY